MLQFADLQRKVARLRSANALAALVLLLTLPSLAISQVQNVAIGTTTAQNSALLTLQSTTKGIWIPRLTTAQMNAVATPATGLLVYNSTMVNFYYYDGTQWVPLVGSGWSLTGDAGTNAAVNFLGTTDAKDLVQKTNYRERFRVTSTNSVGLTSNYNVAEEFRFFEPSGTGNGFYTALKARGQSNSITYRLPLADGSTNSALVTDGSGNLSWKFFATIGGGGTDPVWQRGSGQQTLEGIGSGNHASGKYSMVGGLNSQASGQYAMVWGTNNKGSGQDAVVGGGSDNMASGNHSNVSGGSSNSATGTHTHVGGGSNNSTSGNHTVILDGANNTVSGQAGVVLNGQNNSLSGTYDMVFGSGLTISGSSNIIFYPPGPTSTKLGIGTSNPTQGADIVGNAKFSLALKPNGTGGTAGQYLFSAGSGVPPTWGSTLTIPSTNWRLLGSAGSNPATNFIGTTDAQALAVRTSNTERMRILSTGEVAIGSAISTGQLSSTSILNTDEAASVYGVSTGATTTQSAGVWGDVDGSGSSNTGTIAVLATGNGNTSAGTTNIAAQIADGEFTMGRALSNPSKGTLQEGATAGTAYGAAGPSGVIELSIQTDLSSTSPTAGIYQDLGTVTVNNRYVTSSSIVLATVISKVNGGGNPNPEQAVFKVDVENVAAGAATLKIGMVPTVTDAGGFQGSDMIRVGYIVLNPGK